MHAALVAVRVEKPRKVAGDVSSRPDSVWNRLSPILWDRLGPNEGLQAFSAANCH